MFVNNWISVKLFLFIISMIAEFFLSFSGIGVQVLVNIDDLDLGFLLLSLWLGFGQESLLDVLWLVFLQTGEDGGLLLSLLLLLLGQLLVEVEFGLFLGVLLSVGVDLGGLGLSVSNDSGDWVNNDVGSDDSWGGDDWSGDDASDWGSP